MAKAKAIGGVTTGMSPFTPLELQEMGVASDSVPPEPPPEVDGLGSGWGGISGTNNLAPQCQVPNITAWQVRRYHTRHQNYRRYHYHHAPNS